MDLFKQIVPDSELHENYKRIVNNRYLVEQINKLSLGFGLERDGNGKFIKEFQSTFNSSLWEIYCFALFKDMGCDFDFRHERPDFILKHHSIPFNVECVITNPALNGIPEYDTNEKLYSKKSLDFIVRDQVIRLLNALSSKIDKYRKGYHDLAWVNNNPFIVAIHAFEQAGFMKANTEAIRMALYGWHYDVENETDDYIDNILKENGSPITTGIFTSDCYKEMSGVFFSTLATTGKFRALSREPLCAFEQLRFNESSQLRKYQIDCRLNCKRNSHKYYSYLNHINNHIKKNPVDYQSIAAEPRNPLVCTNGYTETIADGLHFYINPFASTPIPDRLIEVFRRKHIIIHNYNVENKCEEFVNLENGYLIQRRTLVFPKHF